jgi:hypothetical protein
MRKGPGAIRRTLWFAALFAAVIALPLLAAITPTPPTVSVFPTQTTGPITLDFTFGTTSAAGTGTVIDAGTPAGATTVPAPITYSYAANATTARTTFQFAVGAGTLPGTYTVTLRDASNNAGTATITLIVNTPSFVPSAAPNPVTLTIGGSSQPVTVSTTPDPGFNSRITYSFSGFPNFINTGPAQVVGPPYSPVTFTFALGAGAAPGTYPGTLSGSYTDASGLPQTKSVPFTVVVQQPDIAASFSTPSVSLCDGGAAVSNAINLTPVNGYSGTPRLSFVSVPAGINITPATPTAAAMPPGQSIPFTIRASGASSGSQIITLNVSDPAAGINKNINLIVNVTPPDFTPSVAPNAINLVAGGGGQSLTASIAPNACFNAANVIVTPSGQPPGITFTPANTAISAPAYSPVNFIAQAAANVAPGTYPVTFTFTSSSGATKTVSVTINVAATPDFRLSVSPSVVSLTVGQSTTITVSASGVNGFTGVVNVASPSTPDFTFTPAQFSIPSGGSQSVTITAVATAPPSSTLAFTGTAAGIAGTRTANITINVTAAPDFALTVTPPSITVAQASSQTVSVAATAINGLSSPIAVTATPSPGVTVTPSTFTLGPGGAPQSVTVTIGANAAAGGSSVVFTGTAVGVTHTATLNITIGLRPDFALAVTPPAVSIPVQGSSTVVVSVIGSNAFTTPVAIIGAAPAGVTLTPASFTVTPGLTQSVRIDVGSVAAGAATVRFTGTAAGLTHSADLLLTILPPRPVVTSVAPPAVATGVVSQVIRVTGLNFAPGARISVANPGVRIENVSVLSPQVADVTLSVLAEAAPGATPLTLTNPDGGTAAANLLVYPHGSIAAPLGVTSAAIVFPAEGTIVAPGENVFPRGVLATTGTGTIVGVWKFDGVAFDRFVVNAGGGMPAEVRTHIPVPIAFAGGHKLELQVESPQFAVSPALNIVMGIASVSRLTLLAPRDGTVIGGRPPIFRWSLVPNSSGYAVEIENNPLPRRFRVAEAEWQPDVRTLQQLTPGIHRWRVRAIFVGETEGEPTEWQRFAILPQHVDLTLERDGALVRWRGGIAGLLYRVDVLDRSGQTVFSALTAASQYAIPASVPIPAGGSIRVTAFGPGGITLGTSAPVNVAARIAREFVLVQQRPSVTSRQPADGSKVTTTQPRITAGWSTAVRPEDVSMMLDQTDVTSVANVAPTSIAYDALLPLTPGIHTVRLSLAGAVTTWSFEVVETAGVGAEAKPVAPEAPGEQKPAGVPLRTDWAVTPVGTLTVISGSGPGDDARLQLSAQTDLAGGTGSAKVTGDMSAKHALSNPHNTIQESRNWLTQFGRVFGDYKGETKIGYAVPDFVDQSELMSTGVARGGVEARVHFPLVIADAWETFGNKPAGVVAGNFGPKQTIRAFALQTETNPKWDFRMVGYHVHDDPGFNSAGGIGKAVGLFAKYIFDPKLTVLVEAARGRFDPNLGSAAGRRQGSALRLDLTGVAGTFSYILNLRRTEANYVNPANRGFTPGGVPDRTGANLSLTKVINTTSISLQLRTLRDGNSSGAILPRNRENGGTLAITTSLGTRATLALGGNWTTDRGAGNPSLSLPNLDRQQSGVNATVTETAGRFMLSQTLTSQKLSDRVNPISDTTVTAGTLTFGGAVTAVVNLSAVLSGTRSAGSSAVGTTDQTLLSLQPSFMLPRAITFQPRANYTRSKNDLTNSESRSEQYQGLLMWVPTQWNSMVSVQVSADASRNRTTGQVLPSKFIHRYVGTLSLRWGAGNGASMNGTTVVAAPTNVATTNTNNPSTTATVSH